MDSKNTKQSLHLPQEIIEEILARLPVKSLLRFRCVSKSWLSLISTERFIETHLKYSTKNTSLAHHRVIFKGEVLKQCSLHSLLNKPSIDPSSPIDTPTHDHSSDVSVVGCCNGLLCILNHISDRFLLWNPATRSSTELPSPGTNRLVSKYGFGWDETSGAFKVFAARPKITGNVYSTKTNSWKTVESGAVPWYGIGRLACGKIHWFIDNESDIEYFDLGGEEFGRIESPIYNDCLWLGDIGEIRGCLRVMCESERNVVNVWVMKEYGVKNSWFKLLNFPIVHQPETILLVPVLREGPNGEIFLIHGDSFSVYYPKDDGVCSVWLEKKLLDFYHAYFYLESLVSPVRMLEQ